MINAKSDNFYYSLERSYYVAFEQRESRSITLSRATHATDYVICLEYRFWYKFPK